MRLAAFTLLLTFLWASPSAAATIPQHTCGGLGPEAILVRARAAFRARPVPPYVVYTVVRRETVNGELSLDMSYRDRVWYRASDGSALTRRIEGGFALGELVFARPRFNAALDPGPPTADIFEPAAPRPSIEQPDDPAASRLPEIGSVTSHVETDYRVRLASCGATETHLLLLPRRDPDRNRLRELWVDRATFLTRRFVATDRLYMGMTDFWYPDVAEATLRDEHGVPVIASLHMSADTDEGAEIGDYRFDDIAFPATLPAWYFAPLTYRSHLRDAPTW